jgi:hypothetical protein
MDDVEEQLKKRMKSQRRDVPVRKKKIRDSDSEGEII